MARPILAALMNLDSPPIDEGEGGGGTRPRGGPREAGGCSGSAGQCKRPFHLYFFLRLGLIYVYYYIIAS